MASLMLKNRDVCKIMPGRPADNGRVQGGKQGGPKNRAGAVDTAGKR